MKLCKPRVPPSLSQGYMLLSGKVCSSLSFITNPSFLYKFFGCFLLIRTTLWMSGSTWIQQAYGCVTRSRSYCFGSGSSRTFLLPSCIIQSSQHIYSASLRHVVMVNEYLCLHFTTGRPGNLATVIGRAEMRSLYTSCERAALSHLRCWFSCTETVFQQYVQV